MLKVIYTTELKGNATCENGRCAEKALQTLFVALEWSITEIKLPIDPESFLARHQNLTVEECVGGLRTKSQLQLFRTRCCDEHFRDLVKRIKDGQLTPK